MLPNPYEQLWSQEQLPGVEMDFVPETPLPAVELPLIEEDFKFFDETPLVPLEDKKELQQPAYQAVFWWVLSNYSGYFDMDDWPEIALINKRADGMVEEWCVKDAETRERMLAYQLYMTYVEDTCWRCHWEVCRQMNNIIRAAQPVFFFNTLWDHFKHNGLPFFAARIEARDCGHTLLRLVEFHTRVQEIPTIRVITFLRAVKETKKKLNWGPNINSKARGYCYDLTPTFCSRFSATHDKGYCNKYLKFFSQLNSKEIEGRLEKYINAYIYIRFIETNNYDCLKDEKLVILAKAIKREGQSLDAKVVKKIVGIREGLGEVSLELCMTTPDEAIKAAAKASKKRVPQSITSKMMLHGRKRKDMKPEGTLVTK